MLLSLKKNRGNIMAILNGIVVNKQIFQFIREECTSFVVMHHRLLQFYSKVVNLDDFYDVYYNECMLVIRICLI